MGGRFSAGRGIPTKSQWVRGTRLKKLLVVLATLVTGLLAAAFLSPATASKAVQAVVADVHIVGVSSATAPVDSQQGSTTAGSSVSSGTSGLDSASAGAGSALASRGSAVLSAAYRPGIGHSVATAADENCGRFGGGFHGGKHLMVCPNAPFPPPANR
jgi:hypothetical protein